MEREEVERALWVSHQIEKLSEELENFKDRLRSECEDSTVIDGGEKGQIIVTVPSSSWVLRAGLSYKDATRVFGADAEKYFKVQVNVQVDQNAVNSTQNEETRKKLVGLLDQKTRTTRIGFRPIFEDILIEDPK